MDNIFFFIFFFIIIVFILWFFFGGKEYKFEGLNFLDPPKANENTEESYDIINEVYESDPILIDEVCESNLIETSQPSNTLIDKVCDNILIDKVCDNILIDKVCDNILIDEVCDNILIDEICEKDEENVCISTVKIKLPNLNIDYYENFILVNKNSGKHMSRKTAAESRGEKLCRSILEKFFMKSFPTVRPDFLVNPESGVNLELDCYNAELSLALEYNGYQHYVFPNKFHKTQEEFDEQRSKDAYKISVCERVGIYLLIVPYDIPYAKIPQFIEYFLPENVEYRQKNGIESKNISDFWEDKITKSPHGYI